MKFIGFENADFEVFEVSGLDERMTALKAHLRPKLEQLGDDIAEFLTKLLGVQMYPHVAKHARRTVNPPNDSWVAFCPDKRGYKKHPHFQIGAWRTHAFATFGVIYESPQRINYAAQLKHHAEEVLQTVPHNYVWVPNHMDPDAIPARDVSIQRLNELATRLTMTRQGELLVGRQFPKVDAVKMSAVDFERAIQDCFTRLKPLYNLAASEFVAI